MTRPLFALALLAVCGLSCRREPTAQELAEGPDPLAALVSSIASSRYALPFWVREERHQSALWRTAQKACSGKPESVFPNCGSIRVATYWGLPPAIAAPSAADAHRLYPTANPDVHP